MFLARIAETPDREAFRYPLPGDTGWGSFKWKDVGARVRNLASGLRSLGLENEQRVAILSGTRVEWVFADYAILCAGGATTTIYPSSTGEECAYIVSDSNTVMAFVENEAQAAKLAKVRDQLPRLRQLILLEGQGDGSWSIGLDELEARGKAADEADPAKYEQVVRAVDKTMLATLIYTSGTTGKPKGVELTHDCWMYEGEAIEQMGLLGPTDIHFLWLPLSHSFGKVLLSAQLKIGFCSPIDGRIDKIVDNLGTVRPTVVCAVPRIFEKVHNRVVATAKEAGGLKYKIFKWAFAIGKEVSKLRQAGQQPSGLLAMKYRLAGRLVFSKLQQRFGGNLRYFVSGSAPLSRDIAEFFHAADILVLEGYGLTESSAASFVNRGNHYRFGTVGEPLPGTQVKIAGDGEILIKGRGVMRGYHNLAEATAEALDGEGWLHTGDIGHIEDGGFLRITDRKKDLIKTSGGKYVAPQHIEGKLKLACPLVSQVVVHGDARNFCSALLTLDEEALKKWADARGKSGGARALHQDAELIAEIQDGISAMNQTLASYETIKKFALLPEDLTQEAGELTPSLKVKRKFVEKKYMALLDAFYVGARAE
jgi:long-chain acyl-CoA synthetase